MSKPTMMRTTAKVVEVDGDGVRLRVGKDGHQHRILFPLDEKHVEAFRHALAQQTEIVVWIEVPELPSVE